MTTNPFPRPSDAEISHERLLELVSYDPATGHFCNRVGRGGTRPGSALGHVESNGYRRIMVAGHRYLAHRLAWFYMTGDWPPAVVDHKNVCPDDNRWKNLRLATRSQNQANQRKRRGTLSPLKGARKGGKPYCASHLALAWTGAPKPKPSSADRTVGRSRQFGRGSAVIG